MKVNKVKAIFLFLFMPKSFNRLAVEYHEQYVIETKTKYGGVWIEFNKEESAKNNLKQASRLRLTLLESAGIVFVAMGASILVAYLVIKLWCWSNPLLIMSLQLVGGFIILGVTLWEISSAASASGEWLAEKVHNWVFRLLYSLGTFFLGVGVGIDAFANTIMP